jgi:hypothetical protein
LPGNGNRSGKRKLKQVNRRLRRWQIPRHLAQRCTAEAFGIELASRNKLNDLGCVRGLQNLSSLIKGAKRRQSRL